MSGISKEGALTYWDKKYSELGLRVADHCRESPTQAQRVFQCRYNLIKHFITPHLDLKKRVLDFGCGVGRYSDLFSNYLGVDLNPSMIEQAKIEYPLSRFDPLVNYGLSKEAKDFLPGLIFTVTVLQHCDDQAVDYIFSEFSKVFNYPISFFFYENHKVRRRHVCGRSHEHYLELLSPYFTPLTSIKSSHFISNEDNILLFANMIPTR